MARYSYGKSILPRHQRLLSLQDAKRMSMGMMLLTSRTLYWLHQILEYRGDTAADVNGDGVVNIQDLVFVAGAF